MNYQLGVTDCLVIALMLSISAGISIKFRLSGGRQKTTNEYLMAGRNMPILPVIFSTSVTLVSAVSMLGTSSEIYRYGIQHIVMVFSMAIGMALASFVFVPVFFQCGVSTVYEYLELRYGKTTRYVISLLFIIQMVIYMSSVLYAPVMALSAVSNLSIELSIVIFGAICSCYCAVGGLRGVMWADLFQSVLMTITLIALIGHGISDAGGFKNVYDIANRGGRLHIFDFQVDITKRYTFWGCFFPGLLFGFGNFGTSQVEVQRLLSLSNVKKAKSALLLSILPVTGLFALCNISGLVYYAVYNLCDPVLNKNVTGLTKYDQIVPYYIVSRFGYIPGLTGFLMSGIFCGSLSTISSALNSLATVTVMDFIKPLFNSARLTETKAVLLSKALSLTYGLICICLAFTFLSASSVKQVSSQFYSIIEGPTVAVFTLGVLTQKSSGKCVLFGVLVGFSFASWVGYGSLFSGYVEPSLPLSTSGCQPTLNVSSTFTVSSDSDCHHPKNCSIASSNISVTSDTFVLYRISYMWLKVVGFSITILSTFIAVLFTGWNTAAIPSDSKCLSPVTSLWKTKSHIETARIFSKDFQTPMLEIDVNGKELSHPTGIEPSVI